MAALVRSLWMVGACSGGHHEDGGKLVAAVFAGVLTLFRPLIQFMAAFVRPVRVARADARRQQAD